MEPGQVAAWLKVAEIGSRIFGPAFAKIKERIAGSGEESQLPRPETAAEIIDDLDDALEMAQDQLQRFEESSSTNVVRRTFEYQQTQKLASGVATVKLASEILGDDQVPDVEPDYELYSRIFGDVADVSTDEKRIIYAKILAGEIKQPGSTSFKALSILRDLDQSTARIFRQLCSLSMSFRVSGRIFDARVASLGGNPGNNSLEPYGLSFDSLTILNEFGLVINSFNSRHNAYGLAIVRETNQPMIPFHYQGGYWSFVPQDGFNTNEEFRVQGVAMTKAGKELAHVVDIESNEDYTLALQRYFVSQNLVITRVPE